MATEAVRALEQIQVRHLGRIAYADGLLLQQRLFAERAAGEIPDTLLLLEHDPVVTLGRSARPSNVLHSREALAAQGVALVTCDRGGDVTYHGPGQVVAYPIFDLKPDRCDVRRFVHDLEEVMIRCCASFGLEAGRKDGMIGCWIPGDEARPWRKIGAIGVHLSRWISTHGLAFNVAPKMEHFGLIVPCGIADHPVTSLRAELHACPELAAVAQSLVGHFAGVFGAELL